MRLWLFREKLNREIKELEELIEGDRILSERIQPTICCSAALLRNILDKLPKLTKVCTICFGIKQPYQGLVEYRASMYHCGLSAKITASR